MDEYIHWNGFYVHMVLNLPDDDGHFYTQGQFDKIDLQFIQFYKYKLCRRGNRVRDHITIDYILWPFRYQI